MARAERTFVDTNVLVYAHDATDSRKQAIAGTLLESLWTTGAGLLSTQVLQEFYVVATGKLAIRLQPAAAREVVAVYGSWDVVVIDPVLIVAATELHEQRSISYWDALIVVAARQGGATRIVSEDLADGEEISGVRIVNPFHATA